MRANCCGALFTTELDPGVLTAETGIDYDDVQLAAIRQAVTSKVMVLTGGPGTGKTTTTQGIIAALKKAGLRVLLAAPTGRAAKRMSEATGMDAKTIHRLLEYNPQDGYKRNDENPLDGDALIVDECSMIDILLMNNLMKAVPVTMRLVLVGDIDQLPSVGAGNVLRDIIDSQKIPVVRLTRIFRQAQKSRIVMSAHAINQGRFPDMSNGRDTDFFFTFRTQAAFCNEGKIVGYLYLHMVADVLVFFNPVIRFHEGVLVLLVKHIFYHAEHACCPFGKKGYLLIRLQNRQFSGRKQTSCDVTQAVLFVFRL